ncbi:MAG: hypothetical protein A2161_09165 [Candidatus Schekmanbacteria bacterium RBG_13_48_7]|uniref:Uncharacterized protein n=1 Tax=Candidatus Schekmanbacteria bacterium RBG_13_48_7 TaxID=1817878 RepID=A0A1F7S169_9BACT|nr:MAG: hypothetical protein A2161_09165 [Candidatus Schekmanbacteria bacterium RBG_13_48_7]
MGIVPPLSGSGSDATAIHDNVPAEISAITEKGTPIGADKIIIEDSADSHNKKMVQITNLPTGSDSTAIHKATASEIHAMTDVTPASGDEIVIEDASDSWNKKRCQLSDIAPLGTPASHSHTESDITDLDHDDGEAIHDNVAGEITALTNVTPASGDNFLIEDVSDSNNKKKTTYADLDITSRLKNVSEDTTPDLGGSLNMKGFGFDDEFIAGEALTAGDCCYLSTDGKMWKADADENSTCDTIIAFATANISAEATGIFRLMGKITLSGLTPFSMAYVSTTAGGLVFAPPDGAGDIQRPVGFCLSTTVLYIIPNLYFQQVFA